MVMFYSESNMMINNEKIRNLIKQNIDVDYGSSIPCRKIHQ